MKHYDEDILLKLGLELLTKEEEKNIREHLSECEQCRDTFSIIKGDINLIGSFEPDVEPKIIPLPVKKKNITRRLLKVAAILVVGFFVGFLSSDLSNPEKVIVVKQSIIKRTILESTGNFKTCELVDLGGGYKSLR